VKHYRCVMNYGHFDTFFVLTIIMSSLNILPRSKRIMARSEEREERKLCS